MSSRLQPESTFSPRLSALAQQQDEGGDKGGGVWSWAFSDEEQHTVHSKRQTCEHHSMHHRTQYFQLSDDEDGSARQAAKRAKHDCDARKGFGEEEVVGVAANPRREAVARLRHYRVTSKGSAGRLFSGCREEF